MKKCPVCKKDLDGDSTYELQGYEDEKGYYSTQRHITSDFKLCDNCGILVHE